MIALERLAEITMQPVVYVQVHNSRAGVSDTRYLQYVDGTYLGQSPRTTNPEPVIGFTETQLDRLASSKPLLKHTA